MGYAPTWVRRITLSLLTDPTGFIALHPNGVGDNNRYLGELTELARRRDIRFLDFGREVSSFEFFRDPSHLNPTGAARFSRSLAEALEERTR